MFHLDIKKVQTEILYKEFWNIRTSWLLLCILVYAGCRSGHSIPPDKARLCGKFSKNISVALEDSSAEVHILALTHFTDGYITEVPLNEDGTFSVDIPVSCNSLCQINLEGYYIGVYLIPGKKTEFEVSVGQSRKRKLNMIEGFGYTLEERKEELTIFHNILKLAWPARGIDSTSFTMSLENYNEEIMTFLKKLKKDVENKSELSYYSQLELKQSLKMSYLLSWVFLPERPLKQVSDFSFLKYFNLNDPMAFHSDGYGIVLRKMLEDEILDIPPIGDTPVRDWKNMVKLILAGSIGSDTGILYDLLAANSYYIQLKKDMIPFSEQQIKNIHDYFKNDSYADLLLAEHEKIMKMGDLRKRTTPGVPKENLMKTIVSQYKGKIVVVDFWATWCKPCLQAMNQYKTIKRNLEKEKIVFVYITDNTSDTENWKKIAYDIGGEHYILTEDKWVYLMNYFNFGGIPAYLIFDSNGELKNKITAYPGNDEMQKLIEKLLP